MGNHGTQIETFNQVRDMFGRRKMVALNECGLIPNATEMKSEGAVGSMKSVE
jgi:hypothetical protein